MKRKLNRLLALLLCALMMSSEFTGLITPAQAAPADVMADSISQAAPLAATAEPGEPKEFDSDANARPNLFVHFLGDNYFYPYGAAAGLGNLPVPAGFDQSKETNPDSAEAGADPMDTPGNTWARYKNNGDMVSEGGVIFWVGLGIDRREIFELLKDNKGLTSLEAGFYYDDRYIEPYVDASGSFQTTIEKANINNTAYPANTQWSSDYEILRAETGLETKTDPITQEEVITPSFNEIMASSDWKMTYVSLELKDPFDAAADRRLAGEYVGVDKLPTDADGNTVTPESAHGTGMQNAGGDQGENDYQYLLLIPFRLKRYGDPQRLALRLARNATHFSMGAGQEGETTYAAWERVTTRNPGKDIKLLTRFNGDLFLFGDPPNNGEVEYTATLHLDRITALNTAELSVDGDPAVWPVKATQDQDVIHGLRSGLGMRVKTNPQSGYTVTVTVKYKDADDNDVIHTYETVITDREYTFVMPEVPNLTKNVDVYIGFSIDNPQYHVFLSELNRDSLGAITTATKLGNIATITTNLNAAGDATATTVAIHSYDPPYTPHPTHPAASLLDPHEPGPMAESDAGGRVKIEVGTHADYEAVVRIGNYNATGSLITTNLVVDAPQNRYTIGTNPAQPDYGKITLPYGGTITLVMPANDLDVEITYQPAHRYKATLEVYHDTGVQVTPMNTAQMAYLIYDDFNESSTAYSGVVYHLKNDTVPVEDHRAVKGGAANKKLPWIAASQATLSGSLAGDTGQTGMVWNPNELSDPQNQIQGARTVMTQLLSAADLTGFATSMSALDLNTQAVGTAWTGLRKDLQGQSYGDDDVAQLKSYLWEMRTRILSDTTLKGLYEKSVTQTVDGNTTTLYSYLDLTAAQVQAYVLDILESQEIEQANQRQYDLAYQAYLRIKALRDEAEAKPALAGQLVALDAPIPPERMVPVDANGVRRFQGTDYQNGSAGDYLYDYYAYLDSYRTYITTVITDGSVQNAVAPGAAPAKKALQTVDIRTDAAAQTMLNGYTFQANSVSASASIETREDRTVWIALEGDSAYYVKSVELYEVHPLTNASTNLITTITPTQSSSYANLWSFTMPRQNCAVRVTYAQRKTWDVYAQIIGANGEAENLASVEAYRYADHDPDHYPTEVPAVSPVLGVITNDGNHNISPYPAAPADPGDPDPRYIYNVFEGSIVTIRVKAKEGYKTEVKVEDQNDGAIITCTQVTAPDPADGEIYTFRVTDAVDGGVNTLNITVTYIEDLERFDAYIHSHTFPGSTPNTGNEALWRIENPGPPPSVTMTDWRRDVYVGTHLVGDVTVQPGYYIAGVVAHGASGNYSYTLSGDGYNNGYGTMVSGTNQPVKINVNMPGEDLHVEVYFKEGPPPAEPEYPLTLTVKDEDNKDPDNRAKNWAKATVYDLNADGTPDTSATLDTLGVVGLHPSYGSGTLVDYSFVNRGKWVKVDFEADTGYYVSKVTVGPSELGVAMIWESATSVSFYMPAGSTGICVEFAKGEPTAHFLTVRETWFDVSTNSAVRGAEKDNYVTQVTSATIESWNGANTPVRLPWETNPDRVPGADASASATGAAVSGEEVTMTYIVDEANWYVQSIILFSDGAATRLTDKATLKSKEGDKATYEVKFRMPSGDAEFTVHYRKGPRPEKDDYAFTMVLYDSDNTGATKDDNRFKASFTDATGGAGVHPDVELGLALATPITNDVRHIHAGDIVTLETQLQPGYTVDYLIINPSNLGLYPSWQSVVTDASGVTKGVAKFTMPDQGVAVVARYIKDEPHKYTANLILRPPAGYTVSDVGMGTFADPTTGSFDAYPTKAVFSTCQPTGTPIDYDLYAKDGFYIEKVTIEPAVGATASLSGSFGYQSGDFVMPAADVYVNVWFKKGWPDEVKYGLTLEVHDASARPGNYANFRSAGATAFAPSDSDPVHGGQSKTIWGAAFDRDTVVVDIHSDQPKYYYDASCVSITDSQGNTIDWWYVPGGIAFTMPPRSTKVVVTFKDDPQNRDTYKVDLRVVDAETGKALPADNDAVKLAALPTTGPSPSSLTGSGTITGLHAQDELVLSARPGTNRHIASAYAVYTMDGVAKALPIYNVYTVDWDTTPISVDGALSAPPLQAPFVPGSSAAPVNGQFAMPNADVTVYVRFADKVVYETDKWVALKVTGDAGAGYASAEIDEPVTDQTMTVTTLGSGTPLGAVQGMDTRITQQGREVTVTFQPNTDDGYDIIALEVYDRYGNLVPYQWISMLQDPPALTDTNMWPDPPTDPSPTITHPSWKPNPQRQIKLTVPEDCVTVHVTYGKVSDREFNAQVVVNDPYPANATPASRNNAWLSQKAGTDADDALQKKLQTAKPGEWVDLDVYVHPGYKIEYIKVVPQSYGIAPGLPLGDIYDQSTGFYMPNGDCTVYVKFIRDDTELKTATVVAAGTPRGNNDNYATIHSPISGTSDHATVGGLPREADARPTVDWITVDYYWAAGSSIQSISVQTREGAGGVDIPYTQNEDVANRHGQIVLPMAAKDVLITIVYKDDPTPVGQEVVLHVIDKDRGVPTAILRVPVAGGAPLNYGRLQAVYTVGADTFTVDTDYVGPDTAPLAADPYHSTKTIYVPAGERVNLTACSDVLGLDDQGKVYIESAFVLYEAGGQMLNMNLTPDDPGPGFSGPKNSHFIVHQGRNDVYVTLTREAPDNNEYSAVLMLKGPADDAGQAGICVGSDYNTAPADRRDELTQANHGYAYVTATQGEGITINVIPSVGYAIDYIQVTPLGYPLSYTYLVTESTIQFDMPHCNIAITVYLKKAEKDQYKLTLHYESVNVNGGAVSPFDYARVSWLQDDGTQDIIWAWDHDNTLNPPGATGPWGSVSSTLVKAEAPVTLWGTLDSPDVILAAYVLSEGELVPLTPTFPAGLNASDGLEGVGENASMGNNALADALATFDMPTADVDVYLITTNEKPYDKWHTIILTASDYAPSGNNQGLNFGYLKEYGKPDTERQPVKSDGGASHAYLVLPEFEPDGITPKFFTVDTKPAPTYELNVAKTHMTKNTPVYVQALTPTRNAPIGYDEPVGDCNKVVHLVFESDEELTLTVEIDDPDNPGNGTVTNAVTAATTGVDTLELQSKSIAGAYQIMSGVTIGAPVDLTVTPDDGYYAYAWLYTVGADPVEVPLTAAPNGVMTGSFDMPPNTSRVVVTFYLPYEGTLVLRDNSGYPTIKAQMTESTGTAPDTVTVNGMLSQSGTLTKLPNGTVLDANMVDFYGEADEGRKVTGLLTVNGSTTILLPELGVGNIDHYKHTIDRADATITLVVDNKDTDKEDYIAAVRTVNKPAEAADPTIADTTTLGKVSGSIWTTAHETDGIQVHVSVPDGYTAEITTDSALALDGGATSKTVTADGDTTFTMPAHNVQVTVTYRKTHHSLTLHITDTSGVTGNTTALTPAAVSVLPGGLEVLTADGEKTSVRTGADVELAATPATDAKIKYIFYQVDGQAPTFVTVTDPTDPFSAVPLLIMPDTDVDVTVIYTSAKVPDPPPDPDPQDYYIATAVKVDADNDPGNQILSIRNTTRTTLLDGTALPTATPFWTAGYADDAVQVAYKAAPGYYVKVTAQTVGGTALPVLQIGDATLGNATAAFPNPGEDIIITVTYTKEKPDQPQKPVALQLVEHGQERDNKARTTDFTEGMLSNLFLDGTYLYHDPRYPQGVVSDDPVERQESYSRTGNDLRTLANWTAGSQVTRMTVAVRNIDTGNETGEVDLLVSRYGGNATSRCPMPPVGEGEIAVIRVYYGSIYEATLHVVGADPPYDVTRATDNRPNPVSSTGTLPITETGDKLVGFNGGEQVQTTAIPDTLGDVSGVKKRLVGVVWESDLTGARGTTSTVADRYDFEMPKDDVDFYAVYEPEPDDPKDRTYIAKVALAADSQSIAGTQNALSIRNTNNASAASGKYWVAAKGEDSIEIKVKVAQGYQAQVVTTKVDDQRDAVLGQLPDIFDGTDTRKPKATDDYQYYISRTQFVYNLPDGGKEATFTMPADTDATVTIRFTKGYDLSLVVADASLLDNTFTNNEKNEVDLSYNGTEHLRWKNDATTADATVATDGVYTPDPAILKDKEGGEIVGTDIDTYDPAIKVKVTRTTPFTGTVTLTNTTSPLTTDYPFAMPYEDTRVNVLLQDKDAKDDLLAKVQVLGDSDVNGNTATPVVDRDDPAPATTVGAVWTTTSGGNTIDLTLTVRVGYVAKIQVRRDNDNYYNNPSDPTKWDYLDAWRYNFTKVTETAGTPSNVITTSSMVSDPGQLEAGITEVSTAYGADYLLASAFPDTISGQQHFRFHMPADVTKSGTPGDPDYIMGDVATDVTILVTFEKVNDMPRPYDPDNMKMDKIDLDRGFIYGENRGDYAIIEIPTLAKEDGETAVKLFDTDNYDGDHVSTPPAIHDATKTADTEVKRFVFALYDAASGKYTELEEGTDIMLVPYDEETLADPADLYNYILGLYEGNETLDDTATTKREFVGSKFLLLPKPKADGTFTTNGQKVYDMLDNNGSLESYKEDGKTRYRTTLAVMAEDAAKRQSDYTPVWIRPWFALGVSVISYAPVHELTGELYLLMDEHDLNVVNGYWDEDENPIPDTTATQLTPDAGNFKHYQWNSKQKPVITDSIVLESGKGSGKWLQILRIRSSELLGAFDTDYDPTEDFTANPPKTLLDNVKAGDNLTYALALKKDANLTYKRVKIDLNPHNYTAPDQLADYYMTGRADTRTFMIQDTIHLITGDVDGNQRVKLQDYDYIYDFVYRNRLWNAIRTEPTKPATPEPTGGATSAAWDAYYAAKAEWALSTYNPNSWSYRADLDGDRKLTVADISIVRTTFNYNRTEADYNWRKTENGKTTSVLPFGLGARSMDYAALFALGLPSEGEVLPDEYWDQPADLDSEEAEPLDNPWVDENGQPYQEPDPSQTDPFDLDDLPAPAPLPGERVEIPLGEEAHLRTDRPRPNQSVQLPSVDISASDEEGKTPSVDVDITDEVDTPARDVYDITDVAEPVPDGSAEE